jgi:hypothetical protein
MHAISTFACQGAVQAVRVYRSQNKRRVCTNKKEPVFQLSESPVVLCETRFMYTLDSEIQQ